MTCTYSIFRARGKGKRKYLVRLVTLLNLNLYLLLNHYGLWMYLLVVEVFCAYMQHDCMYALFNGQG